jgi:predicted nucleotidyltransferase
MDTQLTAMKVTKQTRPRARGIGNTLFPRIRRQLLTRFLADPERRYYPGEMARMIKTALPPVRHELQLLGEIGILNSARQGQHQYYWANTDCMIYHELHSIMVKTFGVTDVIASALGALKDRIRIAFLFGSVATGDDTARSDIDLIVIGNLSLRILTAALHEIEAELGRPVNPTLFTEAEFAQRYQSGDHFARSISDTEKIFVIGSDDDLAELAAQRLDQRRKNKSRRDSGTS